MKPLLRADTYPVAVEGGVYILRPGGPVRLTGASVAQWLERLSPHLDGRTSVGELTAALPAAHGDRVGQFVAALHRAGVVRDAGEEDEAAGGPAAYRAEIRFLSDFQDRAARRFAAWRQRTALVVGGGPLLPAIVRAALRSGIARVEVVVDGGGPDLQAALAQVAKWAERRDPGQQLSCRWGEVLPELTGMGLVLQLIDGQVLAPDSEVLERWCASAKVPLVQVVTRPGEVWSLPAALDGGGRRWSAVRPRLVAAGGSTTDPAGAGGVTSAAARAVAAATVQRTFRMVTGAQSDRAEPKPVRLDLATLASSQHRVLAHPFSLPAVPMSAAEFEDRLRALAMAPTVSEKEFSSRAIGAVDDRLGLLTLTEYDWAQSPLHLSQARVWGAVGQPAAVGAGFTYLSARCRATMAGLARYAAATVDPRRLHDHDGPTLPPLADPWSALAAIRSGALTGAVWGWELVGPGRPRLVPVTEVFALDARLPAGLAAGYDWREAITTGLLEHSLRITLRAAAGAGPAFPRVEVTESGLAEEAARCRAILAELGELPEVYEVTGSLGVPAFVFCQRDRTVAAAAGCTPEAALADGLRRVLRLVQSQIYQQPGYAPAPVLELAATRRGAAVEPMASRTTPLTVTDLAQRLHRASLTPVAVPLDHDPAVTAILPHLVNVVLIDA